METTIQFITLIYENETSSIIDMIMIWRILDNTKEKNELSTYLFYKLFFFKEYLHFDFDLF